MRFFDDISVPEGLERTVDVLILTRTKPESAALSTRCVC